jgi:hypothetical protein
MPFDVLSSQLPMDVTNDGMNSKLKKTELSLQTQVGCT